MAVSRLLAIPVAAIGVVLIARPGLLLDIRDRRWPFAGRSGATVVGCGFPVMAAFIAVLGVGARG